MTADPPLTPEERDRFAGFKHMFNHPEMFGPDGTDDAGMLATPETCRLCFGFGLSWDGREDCPACDGTGKRPAPMERA